MSHRAGDARKGCRCRHLWWSSIETTKLTALPPSRPGLDEASRRVRAVVICAIFSSAPSSLQQMRVLFIVTAYPRHDGDVITPWMGETIARLKAAGTDVEVLAPAYRGAGATIIGGIRVHRFRYARAPLETLTHDMSALESIRRSQAYLGLLPASIAAGSVAAQREARKGRDDVVDAFWRVLLGVFVGAARRASRAAMVSTFFSAELMWQGSARKVFGPILRSIVKSSDAVTVISSYTAQRLREFVPGARSVTIPFGAAAAEPAVIGLPA